MLLSLIMTAGCSVHPLPEDVTRVSTVDIVQSIRCEAKRAILVHAPEPIFAPAVIGYEFQFQITETNGTALTNLEFKYPFSSGTLALPFNAGSRRDRVGDRNFKIIETFADLKKMSSALCADGIAEPNLRYPIAGSIGLAEVVRTYAELERRTNLAKNDNQANSLPTFSDKLKFTTKIGGGLKPSVKLAQVPGHFRLIDASADLFAERTDLHIVNLAIARDNRNDPVQPFSELSQRLIYINPLAANAIQNILPARDRVLLELDRQRLLELDRLRVVP